MKKRFDKTKKIMKHIPYKDLIEEHKELIKHIPKDDPEYKEQKEELGEYKEELAEKEGYFKGSLVQGTQGGGFNQGGSVPAFDSGTMFGRFFSGGAIESYDQNIDRSGQFADGGEIKPASFMDNLQFKLRELMAKPGSRLAEMSEADKEAERNQQALEFLKMGRMPSQKDKPITPEEIADARQQLDNIQAMTTMSGGIKNIGNLKFIPGMHLKANPEDFSGAIKQAMESSPMHKMNITPYSEKEYASFKTFLSPDKKSGFAIKPDGELVNVFSTEKGRGKGIVQEAVKQGATKLDAFDIGGKLPELYRSGGFETYKSEPNWTPGGPDVKYMALRDKHPELFTSQPQAVSNEQALSKLARPNEFGYYPERPLRHIPDVPESLSSAEKTPVTPSPSNLQEEAEKVNQYLKQQQLAKDELERQALSQSSKVPQPMQSKDLPPERLQEIQQEKEDQMRELLKGLIK